jgi:hypothetical protein
MWHVWRSGTARTGFWWGKPDVRRATGRDSYRWEDNIKTDLNEIVLECPHWIDLLENRDKW